MSFEKNRILAEKRATNTVPRAQPPDATHNFRGDSHALLSAPSGRFARGTVLVSTYFLCKAYQMRHKFFLTTVVILVGFAQSTFASDQTEVRATVQRVFEQLRNHDYSSLYDLLPNTSRTRLSRERFVSALERAQGFYQLDRLEIGSLKVQGNLAVVDTVLYGRVVAPIQAEGKIVAQQYLVREDGKWRVATGDQATVKKFLASTPGFSKGFKIRQPQVFVKQNGEWIEFKGPRGGRNRA